MYSVYLHISPSKKVYVGITSYPVTTRWCGKEKAYSNNPYFVFAIRKYGWDSFEHKVIFKDLTKLDAKLIEIDLIYYYKKIGKCYNITDGGEGHLGLKHTEEFKENLRKRSLGNKYGSHPCSEETKKKISKSNGKPIYQIDKDSGEIINEFDSCHDVDRQLGYNFRKVSYAAKNNKCCFGYLWKYKSNLSLNV